MKDLIVLVATGYEDTELITAINVFNRHQVSYDLVSVENKEYVSGQNAAIVKTKLLKEVDATNYRALFLPGGKGHLILLENKAILQLVKSYQDKQLFAICAAPAILVKANVIKGPFTSYPGFAKHQKNTGKEVEILPKMITARDFKATIPFAEAIVKQLQ